MNLAKATDRKSSSSSIVVSFDRKWHRMLLDGEIRAVVRKRAPTKIKPEWIYVYVNAPISALVAKLPVKKFEWRDKVDASLCKKVRLRIDEIKAYTAGEKFGTFHVGKPVSARPKVVLTKLSSKLGFVPPQSFFVLSVSGKKRLDALGHF